jgi:hypothetical protein
MVAGRNDGVADAGRCPTTAEETCAAAQSPTRQTCGACQARSACETCHPSDTSDACQACHPSDACEGSGERAREEGGEATNASAGSARPPSPPCPSPTSGKEDGSEEDGCRQEVNLPASVVVPTFPPGRALGYLPPGALLFVKPDKTEEVRDAEQSMLSKEVQADEKVEGALRRDGSGHADGTVGRVSAWEQADQDLGGAFACCHPPRLTLIP